MPLLKIETNVTIAKDRQAPLMRRCSEAVARLLGKPESYVMISLESGRAMLFAGDDRPLALLQLKSLGLPDSRTGEFSARLCHLMDDELGIPADRVYIEFSSPARQLWGWNNGTF